MTTRRRFERQAMQEERLEKSLKELTDTVGDLEGVNDLDAIMDGLEAVDKQVLKAMRNARRLMADDDR